MKKTTVYLDDAVLAEIKIVSRSEGKSEAELLRNAVDEYLDKRRSALPTIFGKGSDGKFDAADAEDWLKKNWTGR